MVLLFLVVVNLEVVFIHGLRSGNLAEGRVTSSSSGTSIKARAVDGDHNPVWFSGLSCWEADVGDMNPFWMVDLENEYNIHSVAVTNRLDCCYERLHDIEIEAYTENPLQVSGAQASLCHFYGGPVAAGATETLPCYQSQTRGRYIKLNGLNRLNSTDRFTLCEVEVYASLGSCFITSFFRQESRRVNGTTQAQMNTTRSECCNACINLSTCLGFSYNIGGSVCEIVTVQGALTTALDWDHYSADILT